MEEVEVGGAGVLGPLVSTGESKQGKRSRKQMGRTPDDFFCLYLLSNVKPVGQVESIQGLGPQPKHFSERQAAPTRRSRHSIGGEILFRKSWFCRIFVNWWYCFISSFNVILLREYLANNPEYTVSNNNCQGRIFVREKKITFLDMKAANKIYLTFTDKF